MANTPNIDQRRQERLPFKKDLTVNNAITVKAIDISRGGLYIHTSHPFEVGSIVEVDLPLRGETFKVKAIIKHKQSAVGIGLMFIDMDPQQIEKIDQIIAYAKKIKPRRGTKKIKVLLVDDNQTIRKTLKNHLMSEGLYVIEAENGIDAINALNEHPVDIVVLDLYMDKMNGFKVLSIIKESPEWIDIPVIILSAKGTDDVLDKVFEAGADFFLLKMMTPPAKLVETIKNMLKDA